MGWSLLQREYLAAWTVLSVMSFIKMISPDSHIHAMFTNEYRVLISEAQCIYFPLHLNWVKSINFKVFQQQKRAIKPKYNNLELNMICMKYWNTCYRMILWSRSFLAKGTLYLSSRFWQKRFNRNYDNHLEMGYCSAVWDFKDIISCDRLCNIYKGYFLGVEACIRCDKCNVRIFID